MALYKLYTFTERGSPTSLECSSISNSWPPGYHFLLSLVFNLFGTSERAAFNLSLIFGLISIFSLFASVLTATKNQETSLWCAALLTFTPVFLKFSSTYSLEICSLALTLVTLWVLVTHCHAESWRTFLALCLTFIFLSYIRPENLIIIGLTFGLLLAPELVRRRPAYALIMIPGLFLLIPLALQMYYAFAYVKSPGWSIEPMSHLSYLQAQLLPNFLFFTSRLHPLSMTILTIAGLAALLKDRTIHLRYYILAFSLILIAVSMLLYSSYHVGNFMSRMDSERYTLDIYLAICILGGIGAEWALGMAKNAGASIPFIKIKISPKRLTASKSIATMIIILILTWSAWGPLNILISKTLDRPEYFEYLFIKSADRQKLDRSLDVLCYSTPSKIITLLGHKAMSMYCFRKSFLSREEIILFQDYEYNRNILGSKLEKELLKHFTATPIEYRDFGRNRYAFYLLKRRTDAH